MAKLSPGLGIKIMSFYRDVNENTAIEAWNTAPRSSFEIFPN